MKPGEVKTQRGMSIQIQMKNTRRNMDANTYTSKIANSDHLIICLFLSLFPKIESHNSQPLSYTAPT